MKNLFLTALVLICTVAYCQNASDSINTSIGDFILITSESIESSEVYAEEVITTEDGGSGEFVAAASSARFAQTPVTSTNLQVRVMPNPTPEAVELFIDGMSGTASVVVTDVLGQVVFSSRAIVDSSTRVFLPAQWWTSGTYLIVVSNGVDVKTERLIVE
jgi:hypothetical protein